MDLDSAIAAHQDWKVKLRNAISGKSTLDAATIRKDNCCDLGKWLHGEAKIRFASAPAYRQCVEAHGKFHVEAGRIAGLINSKSYAEAEKALGIGSAYATASTEVATSIIQLKRVATKAA